MSPQTPPQAAAANTRADLAQLTRSLAPQAFQDLAKGEKTAAAMEKQLTALERKIDDLLANVDERDKSIDTEMPNHENPDNEKS